MSFTPFEFSSNKNSNEFVTLVEHRLKGALTPMANHNNASTPRTMDQKRGIVYIISGIQRDLWCSGENQTEFPVSFASCDGSACPTIVAKLS